MRRTREKKRERVEELKSGRDKGVEKGNRVGNENVCGWFLRIVGYFQSYIHLYYTLYCIISPTLQPFIHEWTCGVKIHDHWKIIVTSTPFNVGSEPMLQLGWRN